MTEGMPGLSKALQALMAVRLSDELCNRMGMAEKIARGLEWEKIAEEISAAHEHIHNAIILCSEDDQEITEALSAELEDARGGWNSFIESLESFR